MFFIQWFLFLKKLFIDHFCVLVFFLDPIASLQTAPYQLISQRWQNAHFVFPIIYLVAIVLQYGNLPLILNYSFSSGSVLKSRPSPSQLQYYPTALVPLQVWPQSEVAAQIAFGTAAAVIATFIGRSASFTATGRYEVHPQQRLTINKKSE